MIEKIQKLESLVELRELNLSNNLIKIIEGLDSLVVLEVLDLSCNRITCIPRAVMKKLRSLKELKLSDNQVTSVSFASVNLSMIPLSFLHFFEQL